MTQKKGKQEVRFKLRTGLSLKRLSKEWFALVNIFSVYGLLNLSHNQNRRKFNCHRVCMRNRVYYHDKYLDYFRGYKKTQRLVCNLSPGNVSG